MKKMKRILSILMGLTLILCFAMTVSAEGVNKPKNLQVSTNKNGLYLKWDAVDEATAYKVYVKQADADKWVKYKPISQNYCTIPALVPKTKYKLKVEALSGTETAYLALASTTWSVTTGVALNGTEGVPGASGGGAKNGDTDDTNEGVSEKSKLAPVSVTNVEVVEDGLKLYWSPVEDAKSYKITVMGGDFLREDDKVTATYNGEIETYDLKVHPECHFTITDLSDVLFVEIQPLYDIQARETEGVDGDPTRWIVLQGGFWFKFPAYVPEPIGSASIDWAKDWSYSTLDSNGNVYITLSKHLDLTLDEGREFLKKSQKSGYAYKRYKINEVEIQYIIKYNNKQVGQLEYNKETGVMSIAFLQKY